jgi:multiple sugar transport system ATP-binding protein
MNMVTARIATLEGGRARLQIGADALEVPAPSGVAVGQDVMLGVRPEHLRLSDAGLPAEVRVVEPTGSETHVVLRFHDQEVTADFRERVRLSPGEKVHLAVDEGHVHLFDASSGARIG